MSTTIPPSELDLREQIARIDQAREQALKFTVEQHTLLAEQLKFSAEQQKLIEEGRKFRRERWLLAVGIVTAVSAAFGALGGAALLPALLRLTGRG